ncbi:RDD family protein [Roseimarinus sediminis]|uniref:RDD family protein n=1 Tax=Roseimarinus sediminis TaxID=1610899 RepID=UPI003D1A5BB2
MSNFYRQIYERKTSQELIDIVKDINTSTDSKELSINILKERNELPDDINDKIQQITDYIDKDKSRLLHNEKYKTIGPRIAANAIDGLVLIPISLTNQFLSISRNEFLIFMGLILSVIIPYLYSILMHGYFGQTLGKMSMSIKVMDKNEKDTISMRQAFYRDAFPFIGSLILIGLSLFAQDNQNMFINTSMGILGMLVISWSLIEILTLMTNKKHRALHDYIAMTTVLKIKNKASC